MDVVIEWIFIFILIPSFSSLICSFIFFSQSISSSAFAPRQAEKKKDHHIGAWIDDVWF